MRRVLIFHQPKPYPDSYHRAAKQVRVASVPEVLPCGSFFGYCGQEALEFACAHVIPYAQSWDGLLERIWADHNRDDRHDAAERRSLSVGDVIVFSQGEQSESAWAIEDFGMRRVDLIDVMISVLGIELPETYAFEVI